MKRHFQAATAPAEQPHSDRHSADLYTQIQICRRLGISDESWRRWRARGITPPKVELPGHPRWRVVDVEAFIAGRRWRNTHLSLSHTRQSGPRFAGSQR